MAGRHRAHPTSACSMTVRSRSCAEQPGQQSVCRRQDFRGLLKREHHSGYRFLSRFDGDLQPVSAVANQAASGVTVASFTDTAVTVNPRSTPRRSTGATATVEWNGCHCRQRNLHRLGHAHLFAPGTYNFSVQVTDPDGNKGTATGSATVTAPANTGGPQNLVANPVAAVIKQPFSNVVLATFTDSDPNANSSDSPPRSPGETASRRPAPRSCPRARGTLTSREPTPITRWVVTPSASW